MTRMRGWRWCRWRNYVPANGATSSVAAFLAATGLGGFGPNAPWVPTQSGNLGIFFPNNSALPQANYGSRNDIHELPGMQRFNMADRDQQQGARDARLGRDRQALAAGQRRVQPDDDYNNSVYGLQNAKSLAINLEGSYQVSENFNANGFLYLRGAEGAKRGRLLQRGRRSRTPRT